MRTGRYEYSGYINYRATNGYWWSTTSNSAIYGRYLITAPGYVNFQADYYRGFGFAIRCTIRVE